MECANPREGTVVIPIDEDSILILANQVAVVLKQSDFSHPESKTGEAQGDVKKTRKKGVLVEAIPFMIKQSFDFKVKGPKGPAT